MTKHLQKEEIVQRNVENFFMIDPEAYEQINLCFSTEKLLKLRSLIGGDKIIIQNALTSHVIVTLNTCR